MPIEYLPSAFARVALDNVERAYSRRLDQLLAGPDAEWRPGVLHPAFYGSYDWHAAVHMHWLLVRMLSLRSEERRVGQGCRHYWCGDDRKKEIRRGDELYD